MTALTGIALPFRWLNALAGSPIGLALAFVSALLLRLDIAVRDEKPSGGWLAGAALRFAASSVGYTRERRQARGRWCRVPRT